MENNKTQLAIQKSLKRKEFWIGIVVFLLLAGAVYQSTQNYVSQRSKDGKKTAEQVVKPTVSTTSASPAATMDQKNQPRVKQLANTSGNVFVVVRVGDSYAQIAQRVCGRQTYYRFIQAENGSMPLQPGDIVVVTCN